MPDGVLHTVCEEARCPNIGKCWNGGTATFMVLGETCTRGCRFCSVKTQRTPPPPDPHEPGKLAESFKALALRYAVITTVCRDDLPDQGAAHLAECIRVPRARVPGLRLEALIQDFRGARGCIQTVVDAEPDVLAHNLETVERLTHPVRDARAGYRQSLEVLKAVKEMDPGRTTKSSLMLGLGETEEELLAAMQDLRAAGVDILTLGQYLRPGPDSRFLPVEEYVSPQEFRRLRAVAREMGFSRVASAPLVRSSYRAGELHNDEDVE